MMIRPLCITQTLWVWQTKGVDAKRGEYTHKAESSLSTLLPQPPSTLSSATLQASAQRHRRASTLAMGSSTVRTPGP
ncbi:hypothetical protein E2C01_055567 [Portunus trituberculatus]|uniref:Uncharacterized protein n=1 Tax=Portunus trituberculatus TaxID=210409 RepID=A0A5B7GY13_PORTR|nr:hypothetical protein [Portunus trituberculatus]